MSFEAAERLARSLLFEGYVLYPYRRSSLKNQQRWTFGTVYPPGFCAGSPSDASSMRTECLVAGDDAILRVCVRFLQFVTREADDGGASLPWQEAIERRVDADGLSLRALLDAPKTVAIGLPAGKSVDHGVIRVERAIRATVTVSCESDHDALHRVRVTIENHTDFDPEVDGRVEALARSLVSTHTIVKATGGRFVSLLEPPQGLEPYVARCKNEGTWPVLVGDSAFDDVMLSSPIILYDRPLIAPESPGDLFDATEIDEILTLRILTLTEEERREVRATDPRARAILERTEALDEQGLLSLHGAFREGTDVARRVTTPSNAAGRDLAAGDRVRIRPRPHGDVLDLALADELATIVKVEEDLEGRTHYAVTIDADPGRDLGLHGQPGHRFYFHRDELELHPDQARAGDATGASDSESVS